MKNVQKKLSASCNVSSPQCQTTQPSKVQPLNNSRIAKLQCIQQQKPTTLPLSTTLQPPQIRPQDTCQQSARQKRRPHHRHHPPPLDKPPPNGQKANRRLRPPLSLFAPPALRPAKQPPQQGKGRQINPTNQDTNQKHRRERRHRQRSQRRSLA